MFYEYSQGLRVQKSKKKINTVFNNELVSRSTDNHWWKRFRESATNVKGKPTPGRPLSLSTDDIKAVIKKGQNLTCRDLALIFRVSAMTIYRTLKSSNLS